MSARLLNAVLIITVIVNIIISTASYKKLDEKVDKLEASNKYSLQRSDTIMTLTTDVEKLKKESSLYHHHLVSLDGQLSIISKDTKK